MIKRVIALLTDFGVEEHYNGVMKGVILKINRNALILDLVASAKSFSIMDAAFQLWASYKYFPYETIFLVVVDPGVGTDRQPLVIKTKNYFFVGPDNGVLYPAAYEDGIESVVKITSEKIILKNRNGTFDGRDVFAPAAAYLSKGMPTEALGQYTEIKEKYVFPEPIINNYSIKATVLHVDKFGDVVLNLRKEHINDTSKKFIIKDKNVQIKATFAECVGLCMVFGSSGFYELALNQGSASDLLKIKTGDEIEIEIV